MIKVHMKVHALLALKLGEKSLSSLAVIIGAVIA